jgi:hypothetical protein
VESLSIFKENGELRVIKRSTWILVAIFIFALAGTIFWDRTHKSNEAKSSTVVPTSIPKLFSDMKSEDIVNIEFQNQSNSPIRLEKSPNDQWIIKDSLQKPPLGKIEQVITTIMSLTPLDILNLTTLEGTGIPDSKVKINLINRNGTNISLVLGKETSTGSGIYAQKDQEKVVLLHTEAVKELLDLLSMDKLLGNEQTKVTPTP